MRHSLRRAASCEACRALRCVVILNRGAVNGAVRQLAHWVPTLRAPDFETTVVFLRDVGPLGDSVVPPGARIVSGILRHRWDGVGALSLLVRARRWKPDVVFSIDERNAMILSRLAGRVTGARVIHAVHSFPSPAPPSWWDRATRRWVWRFVALSESHATRLVEVGVPRARIAVVENGVVDRTRAERAPEAAMTVAFVGVLRRDKRVDLLLDAVASLATDAPALAVVVAGDGPERERLRAHARSLGIDGRVRWLGWVDDVDAVLRASDVLVLPSAPGVEALSMAVLEAMAVGLPVVATDVGSMRDAVTPETGFLVPSGDVSRLAEALRALARDRALRVRLGHAGWRRQRSRFSASRLPGQMREIMVNAARAPSQSLPHAREGES